MLFQYFALRIASCGFYLFIFPFVSVSYSKYGERNKMKEEIQYFVCAHTTHHRCVLVNCWIYFVGCLLIVVHGRPSRSPSPVCRSNAMRVSHRNKRKHTRRRICGRRKPSDTHSNICVRYTSKQCADSWLIASLNKHILIIITTNLYARVGSIRYLNGFRKLPAA